MDTPTATNNLVRSEEFVVKYANNVQFELGPWDLRMLFGQLESAIGPNGVMQHTAITMPWPQVKIMSYFLEINLMIHEHLNGRVTVPGGIIPSPDVIKIGSGQFGDEETVEKLMLARYEDFIKTNPEAVAPSPVVKHS